MNIYESLSILKSKIMKNTHIILLAVLIAACSSTKITYDYDKQADFSKYNSFNFDQETIELPINQLNRDRLLAAIENEMVKKGFTKSNDPDAIIHVDAKVEKQVQARANTTGTGMGYGRWGGYGYGGGFSTTTINYDEYHDGTLFISLVDRSEKKIIWQGVATKTLNETASADKREKNINSVMEQVFRNYPPR